MPPLCPLPATPQESQTFSVSENGLSRFAMNAEGNAKLDCAMFLHSSDAGERLKTKGLESYKGRSGLTRYVTRNKENLNEADPRQKRGKKRSDDYKDKRVT